MALPVSPLRLEVLSGLAPCHILDKDFIPLFKSSEGKMQESMHEWQSYTSLLLLQLTLDFIAGTAIFYKFAEKME